MNAHEDKPVKHACDTSLANIVKTWSSVLGHLSHFLVTKMATLRMKQSALQRILPSLLKGYRLAVKQKLMPPEIQENNLKLADEFSNLDEQLEPMFGALDSLNNYCEQLHQDSKNLSSLTVQTYLKKILETYPFQTGQKSLVSCELAHDFLIGSSPVYFSALLEQLLTRSLKSIHKAGKGSISIWTSEDAEYFILNFKDTGLGFNEEECAQIFDSFLFEEQHKIVLGIGFFRLAIQHIGGDVFCNGVNGEFTHFTIKFLK